MAVLLRRTYRLNMMAFNIAAGSFEEIDKLIPKLKWEFKEPRVAKTILTKKNKVGSLAVLDFKISHVL